MASVSVPAGSLTIPEAAIKLGIHERTLWRWIRDGKIEHLHVGPAGNGVTLIPPKAIENAPSPLERGNRVKTPEPPKATRKGKRRPAKK